MLARLLPLLNVKPGRPNEAPMTKTAGTFDENCSFYFVHFVISLLWRFYDLAVFSFLVMFALVAQRTISKVQRITPMVQRFCVNAFEDYF